MSMTATDLAGIPPVREVRTRLRRVRRTHSDKTLGELLTDVYLIAFLIALYGGSAVVTLRRHLYHPTAGAAGLVTTRGWLVLALLATLTVLAWRGLRTLGPLLVTPAAQTWCLSTPIDRAAWLRAPLLVVLAVSAAAGAIVGVLANLVGLPEVVWSAALGGAALGLTLAAASVVAQSRSGRRPGGRVQPTATNIALLVGLLGVTGIVVERPTAGQAALPWWTIAPVGLAAAVISIRAAARSLARVERTSLAGGAQLAEAAAVAVVMLDPSLLSGLVESRRWRGARRLHSRHFLRGGRFWVLVQADLRRQWRRRSGLMTWVALILAPYAIGVFSPAAVGSIRVVAAYLAMERLAAGLRLVSRSPALRRSLGGPDGDLKLAHLVVPTLGLAIWWYATVLAGHLPTQGPVLGLVLLGIIGAVYRTATRPPMSYDVGNADTPFGPVPTTLLRRLLRGPDLLAVVVLVNLIL
jgi:hypothetical protein